MTRLISSDITEIADRLQSYDGELLAKTGRSLLGIACHAAGAEEKKIREELASLKTAVIPITSGLGYLPGFSEAVRSIGAHLGCRAFVTNQTDVGGLGEAIEKKSDLMILADDDKYLAMNLKKHVVVDNDQATAQGFAAGLDLMACGAAGKKCLVIGCGSVGRYAALALLAFQAEVSVYDLDLTTSQTAAEQVPNIGSKNVKVAQNLQKALEQSQLVFEATNSADVIPGESISPDMFIAAPGMPLGVDQKGISKAGSRIIHDPLQIGTATMLVKIANE